MKKYYLILLLCITNSLFSQIENEFQKEFKYYKITEFTKGMKFMVEANGNHINIDFKKYHKKGRGKIINLNEIKGNIFEFERYETRKVKNRKFKHLILIFTRNNEKFEYNTYKTKEELNNQNKLDNLKTNVQEFVFYDDVEIAKKLLINKEFYLTKLYLWTHNSIDRLFRITKIEPNTSDKPIKIEFTDVINKQKIYKVFRLSFTNEHISMDPTKVDDLFTNCFKTPKDYLLQKEKEKYILKSNYYEIELKPNEFSKATTHIKRGEKIKFIDFNNGYFYLEYKGVKGYLLEPFYEKSMKNSLSKGKFDSIFTSFYFRNISKEIKKIIYTSRKKEYERRKVIEQEKSLQKKLKQIVYIPDDNFKKALLYNNVNIDKNYDGEIQVSEAEALTLVLEIKNKNIHDLTGIEFFTNLWGIDCSYNQLESLNLSKNTNLGLLNCNYNQLKTLDVSKNINLTSLFCYDNQLSTLNISNNTKLTILQCFANQLKSLDTSNNIALIHLMCSFNQLYSLDVSNNHKLISLSTSNTPSLRYINLKNGNNINMKIEPLSFSSLPNLHKVCVDELNTELTSSILEFSTHHIIFTRECN